MKFEIKQKALYELALYDAEFNRKLAELKEAEENERREHVIEIWMDKNGIYSLIEEVEPALRLDKKKTIK